MYGFHSRAWDVELPDWAGQLIGYYWRIRVEGRDKNKRRRYYRYVEKEKLRLAEIGIEAEKIEAVCKYLVSLKQVNADRLNAILESETKQLSFNFFT